LPGIEQVCGWPGREHWHMEASVRAETVHGRWPGTRLAGRAPSASAASHL